jgi:hypothetical protein
MSLVAYLFLLVPSISGTSPHSLVLLHGGLRLAAILHTIGTGSVFYACYNNQTPTMLFVFKQSWGLIIYYGTIRRAYGNPIICYGGYAVLATVLMRTLQYGTLTLVNANWGACSNLARREIYAEPIPRVSPRICWSVFDQ